MSVLSKDVQYRIQNVEYATYLELPEKIPNSEIKTRMLKNSEKQLWTATVDDDNSDLYMFENVAQKTWLGIITDGNQFSQLVSKRKADASKWWLDKSGDAYQISLMDNTSSLQLGDFGIIYINNRNHNGTQKWRFLTEALVAQSEISQANRSLPDGQYRIRNLNGFGILTLPDANAIAPEPTTAYVSTNIDPDSAQKWSVTSNDDGSYIVENSTQGRILGGESYEIGKYGKVHGIQSKFAWQLNSVGRFAYTINVKGPSGLLAAGFRNYQADFGQPVVLMPSNGSYNQIWFFETWDKPEPGGTFHLSKKAVNVSVPASAPVPDSSSGSDSVAKPPIDEGHYFIKNFGLETYLHTETKPSLSANTTGSPARYFVNFQSNTMQIVPHSYPGMQSLCQKDAKVEVHNKTEYAWSITRKEKTDTFYIFVAGDKSDKVLAAKDKEVEIADKGTDDSKQLWEFIVVF